MADNAATRTRRLWRRFAFVATLAIAGVIFTVGLACFFAADDWARLTQTSSVVREGRQTYVCFVQHGPGATRWMIGQTTPDPGAVPLNVPSWVIVPQAKDDLAETDAFGWPMRALCRHRVLSRPPATPWGFSVQQYDSVAVADSAGRAWVFPAAPIWIGLGCDTVVWAAALWAVWALSQLLRNFVVLGRGRCLSCGYDRRGLTAGAACPECGAPPRGPVRALITP